MKFTQLELRRIHLELVTPFRTSFGEQTAREILLIGITSDDGTVGWGECVAMSEPLYSPEYVSGVETMITEFLAPRLTQGGDVIAGDVADILRPIKGHQMAKAAIEMAVLTLNFDLAASTCTLGLVEHATRFRVGSPLASFLRSMPCCPPSKAMSMTATHVSN